MNLDIGTTLILVGVFTFAVGGMAHMMLESSGMLSTALRRTCLACLIGGPLLAVAGLVPAWRDIDARHDAMPRLRSVGIVAGVDHRAGGLMPVGDVMIAESDTWTIRVAFPDGAAVETRRNERPPAWLVAGAPIAVRWHRSPFGGNAVIDGLDPIPETP